MQLSVHTSQITEKSIGANARIIKSNYPNRDPQRSGKCQSSSRCYAAFSTHEPNHRKIHRCECENNQIKLSKSRSATKREMPELQPVLCSFQYTRAKSQKNPSVRMRE